MYQAGGYPMNPAYSNQYAQYPQQYQQGAMPMGHYPQQYQGAMPMGQYPQQYQGATPMAPYGAAQQSYQNHSPQLPGSKFENRSENPCRCCCGLANAAKTLAVLNLVYLVMELVDLLVSQNPLPWGWDSSYKSKLTLADVDRADLYSHGLRPRLIGKGLFYHCMDSQANEKRLFYVITLTLFISSIAAYFVATIGFMVAVFGSLGTKIELLCSNIFMWMSFFHVGWLCRLLLLVDMLLLGRHVVNINFGWFRDVYVDCQGSFYLWAKYLIFAVLAAIISVYNGLVGKGFRNMVERRSKESAQVPEEKVEEVPATEDKPPVEESVPTEEENAKLPEIEQP